MNSRPNIPLNLPIVLTWLRIVAIPLIVGVYLPRDLPYGIDKDVLATIIFVAAALTDWLDGFLARRWQQTSSFGAFLDPVADKLMVVAALLVLLDLGRVNALIALVIIGRELTISALREWMAQIGASRSVAVHWLGKVKTIAQMVAIPMLLFDNVFLSIDTALLGTWLIYVAAVLTVWSMMYYMRKAYPQILLRTRTRVQSRLRRGKQAVSDTPPSSATRSASVENPNATPDSAEKPVPTPASGTLPGK